VTWVLVALLGLAFGSFLNVCIWRIPRGESIVAPPSHCPRCNKLIAGYDNIPVLSYIILRGRCRHCRKPISIRYPLVEALTGALFLAAFARFGPAWPAVKAAVLICLLVSTALIDLDLQIIPFQLSIPGIALGLAGAFLPPQMVPDAFIAAAAGAGFVGFAILLWRHVLSGIFRRFGVDQKEGMGFGDLPYAAMIGAFIGWRALVVALFAAVAFGVVGGLVARAAGRNKAGQPVPFGPFLALGGLVGLFFGDTIFAWYVGTMLH
jgi:leader peptidase (prepilin peptidase) / N-methyltransferase